MYLPGDVLRDEFEERCDYRYRGVAIVPSSQRYESAIGGLLAMALACFVAGVLIFGLAPVCAMATGNRLAVARN